MSDETATVWRPVLGDFVWLQTWGLDDRLVRICAIHAGGVLDLFDVQFTGRRALRGTRHDVELKELAPFVPPPAHRAELEEWLAR